MASVIADQDGDGRISRSEAETMMKSPDLKSKLFNASADAQADSTTLWKAI